MSIYYVYILASKKNGTLYVGVTNDLIRRVHEHRNAVMDGFTKDHSVSMLVYYENNENITDAIAREKEIKKWMRSKKVAMIEKLNPHWDDLYEQLCR
jgi:putative endonuclease